MRRFLIGLACGVGGYVLVALISYFLVMQLSSNRHDRSVEAAMTSVFVFGPIGGVVGLIIGLIKGGKPS